MTVPVARTQVRRNVRMAVALVVGQAVLCVVIGYIALGGLGGHPGLTPQAVGPLAAPTGESGPPDGPSVTSRPPSKPGQPSPRGIPAGPPVLPDTIAAPPGPANAPQILDAPGAEPAAGTTDPTVAATSPATSGSGSPPPTDDQGAATPQNESVQPNAVLGGPCDKPHENGMTSDGVDVVCLPDSQGDLTWQLPKQPPSRQNK